MCEERKWKKDIHIQLANMKYTDSCIEILQNSDLGRAYFSDYEKAANMLTYAVGQEKHDKWCFWKLPLSSYCCSKGRIQELWYR